MKSKIIELLKHPPTKGGLAILLIQKETKMKEKDIESILKELSRKGHILKVGVYYWWKQ